MIDAALVLAWVWVIALTCFALLGGADYGGGVWDLLASGPSADRQRATIARAIGPVWEANHVWLILAVVIAFTGFPVGFSAVSTVLHIPLSAMLVGIVMRGSAFVFRAYGPDDRGYSRLWGRVFAVASTTTPLFLGIVVGAITEGRWPVAPTGGFVDTFVKPWVTPFAISVGVLTLVLFAYLAAVYLTLEAPDPEQRQAFRVRALTSGVAAGIVAATVLVWAPPEVRRGVIASAWAPPLHLATGVSAIASLAFLWGGRYAMARLAAAAQVTLILWGWALAQYPYVIRPHVTVQAAAAPEPVMVMLRQVIGVGAVLLLPSLLFLFRLFGPRGDHTTM